MKKFLILISFAIMIIACGDNSVSPEPTYTQPVQQPTYSSSSIQQTQTSSQTIQINPQPTYSVPTQTYIESSSSTSYWSLEIGNVCNGYNINVSVNDKSKPVEGYIALNKICGDMSNFTYECEPMEQSVKHIMSFLNKETALQVVDLAENYGAAFGFYNANDGYMRYIYFEQCYDGKALMKRQ